MVSWRTGAVLLLVMGWPDVAFGETKCLEIRNDLDRLACYDRASGRTPKVSVVPTEAGNWKVEKEVSKLTDRTSVFLSVASDEVVHCGWSRGNKIRLIIRCHENTTALIFNTGCHMTSGTYNNYGEINYRIDSERAQKISAVESTNNRSLGLWSGGQSIPLIKHLFGKSRMVVKMTPYSESSFTATFDVTGLEKVIAPLRKSCGW